MILASVTLLTTVLTVLISPSRPPASHLRRNELGASHLRRK